MPVLGSISVLIADEPSWYQISTDEILSDHFDFQRAFEGLKHFVLEVPELLALFHLREAVNNVLLSKHDGESFGIDVPLKYNTMKLCDLILFLYNKFDMKWSLKILTLMLMSLPDECHYEFHWRLDYYSACKPDRRNYNFNVLLLNKFRDDHPVPKPKPDPMAVLFPPLDTVSLPAPLPEPVPLPALEPVPIPVYQGEIIPLVPTEPILTQDALLYYLV